MNHLQYDLVVIGSGPAGEKGGAQASYFGKKVALIEKESVFGGAAANTGTIPSKTLRETSLMLSGFRARRLYGVDLAIHRELTVKEFLYRERHVVEAEQERAASNIESHNLNVYRGVGSFVDPHTIKVDSKGEEPVMLEGQIILIATGSHPYHPDIYPFDHPRIYDSDSILQLHDMPQKLAIFGAGIIGSEYACLFAAMDIEVFLIDGRDNFMGFLDVDVSNTLRSRMTKLGIEFIIPANVEKCEVDDDSVALKLDSGRSLEVDAVLVASGRTGNTATLNLHTAGLEADRRGQLDVNEEYQTSVPHIYAAGDVIGFPALASTSMEQARLAMVNAFQLIYKKEVAPILPYGIYTIPEVSMAGESEQSLNKAGVDYVVGKAGYGQNARGMIVGDLDGFLKLIFNRDDMKLLGVHVIGEAASEIVHIGLTALMMNADSDLFIRTCYNYPTLSELYKYATYDAMGSRQRAETRIFVQKEK